MAYRSAVDSSRSPRSIFRSSQRSTKSPSSGGDVVLVEGDPIIGDVVGVSETGIPARSSTQAGTGVPVRRASRIASGRRASAQAQEA